jgi:hypothetical protein
MAGRVPLRRDSRSATGLIVACASARECHLRDGIVPAKISPPSRASVGLVRFWVFIGAAVLAVLLEVADVRQVVDWWGVPYRACGPNCVVTPSPWSHGVLALVYMAGLFALGAVFAYLAIRARRRRV